MNSVLVERGDVVWTITINRPEVRNAVDGPTAHALAHAFREFDADPQACVAVLAGTVQHRDARIGIGVEAPEGVGERVGSRAVDGVAHLGPVQRDGPDGAVTLDQHGVHRGGLAS